MSSTRTSRIGGAVANSVSMAAEQQRCSSFVYHSIGQSIPTGVWTSLGFDTNGLDVGPMHTLNTSSTTIAVASNGATLPTGTINVADTTGFPSSGSLLIKSPASANINVFVAYTGKTGTTFTGCTLGVGTLATGQVVTVANEQITMAYGGLYAVAAQCTWAANNTGSRRIRVVQGGLLVVGESTVPTTNTADQGIDCAAQPYATAASKATSGWVVQVFQDSGSTITCTHSGVLSPACASGWISPASDGV